MTGNIGADNSVARFMQIYEEELRKAIVLSPDQYCYSLAEAPAVVERMENALYNRSANIGSPTFRRTCKRCGIKHTVAAINALFVR
jgi:hypothetical protein